MKFFLESASLDEIEEVNEYGLLDGVLTSKYLLSQQASNGDWREAAKAICQEVDGPVNLSVNSTGFESILQESKELIAIAPNVMIQIPVGQEGLKAVNFLSEEGVDINVTSVCQPFQAVLAAKSGAVYISPFIHEDYSGSESEKLNQILLMYEQILDIYSNYYIKTQVLMAGVYQLEAIHKAVLNGIDAIALPFAVLKNVLCNQILDKV